MKIPSGVSSTYVGEVDHRTDDDLKRRMELLRSLISELFVAREVNFERAEQALAFKKGYLLF